MRFKRNPLSKRWIKVYFAIVLWVASSACSPTMQVYSDYDRELSPAQYATFNWGKPVQIESGNNPLYYNELNDKRIKSAVEDQLSIKGYRLSNDSSSIVIHYHIIVEDESMVPSSAFGDSYSRYWMNMQVNTYSYKEGTLIIDLMAPKTNALIWRGWATAALDVGYSPDQIDNLVKKAVGKIFKSFPERWSQ